jgi:hypothetical protein
MALWPAGHPSPGWPGQLSLDKLGMGFSTQLV